MLVRQTLRRRQIYLPGAKVHHEGCEEEMNFVQPIRDVDLVKDICDYLYQKNKRNYILFLTGIYTGRRISDILKLRVKDVKDKNHTIFKEQKTGKITKIDFNWKLKNAYAEYCADKPLNEFLIKSRKGKNKPIDRSTAYMILKETAELFGLDQIGTHTMRKTFGYHLYKQNKNDVALVMKALGHYKEAETLRYIGVDSENVNKAIKSLRF